jgi:hypothetical protein
VCSSDLLAEASEERLSPEDVDTAKVILLRRFLLPAKEISPGNFVRQADSINAREVSERKRTWELLKRYGKNPAHARAIEISHEISRQLSSYIDEVSEKESGSN